MLEGLGNKAENVAKGHFETEIWPEKKQEIIGDVEVEKGTRGGLNVAMF